MDYEIMMNGNVKIGQLAPDFEATTTCGNIKYNSLFLQNYQTDNFADVQRYNCKLCKYVL